jgi:hypothetical protein
MRYIKTLNNYSVLVLGLIIALQVMSVTSVHAEKNIAKFTENSELKRPVGYREWIYIGTPLTPNDMNDGKAAFPEFHNVYINPTSWTVWKKSGYFPDETIIVKELVSVGSKKTFSGNGYFMGEYIGLEAMVKSKKQFPKASGNWGFFRFTNDNYKGLKKIATVLPASACLSCHIPNAQYDNVFTQHYPVLRAAKAKGEMGIGGK